MLLPKKLKKRASITIGFVLIMFIFLMMITSLFYTPYEENKMMVGPRFSPPAMANLFGTDNFGRDIFSRIMVGTQTAFLVGTIAVSIALIGGIILGAMAGYWGGWIDEIIMRIIDAMMSFPGILVAIMFIAVFGPGLVNTMIAIGIISIPNFARISRSGFIQYREFEFVKAAKSIGAGSFRIMFIHILPNIISPLIVAASLGFATSILAESALSYLGLGVQPPHPSWGRMLNEAQSYMMMAPWYAVAPGIMITISVLGFNILGDGIRDLLDPRK